MPNDAATRGDRVIAMDRHLANGALVSVPFDGPLDDALSADVLIEHRPAAMVGSRATNDPPHVPPPGKTFDRPPSNRGTVTGGSATVLVNHRGMARNADAAETCSDPDDAPGGSIVAACSVKVGG